jgi:hypothetical protein
MPVSCLSLCASFNLFEEFSPMIIVIAFAQISPLTAAGAPLCEERLRSGKHCVLSLSYYFQSVACFVHTLICALQIKISAVTLSSACKLAKRRHRAICADREQSLVAPFLSLATAWRGGCKFLFVCFLVIKWTPVSGFLQRICSSAAAQILIPLCTIP